MTAEGVAIARVLLDRFEAGIAARDVTALIEMCTEDVVLFGSTRANVGREEARRYLDLVVQANTLRWLLSSWSVLHHDDKYLLVAATGEVEFDEGSGPERSEFRLSLWLVRVAETWKVGHFHGSVPAV